MGTNYYTIANECETCHRYETVHLGKSSGGWRFMFNYNGGKLYKDIPEMKIWLADKIIKDEYDSVVSVEDFWALVEQKQADNRESHSMNIGGYSFIDCDFS